MKNYYIILFPIPEYIENDYRFKCYSRFIQAHSNCNLLDELKYYFMKKLNEIRKKYTIIWYITKDSIVSEIFEVDNNDKIIGDSLSTKDLLSSTKYSNYENLINELKHYKNLEEIVVDGFHRNDCVIKCCNILYSMFRNAVIKINDKISDIAVETLIKNKLWSAHNAFTLAKIS